MLIALSIVCAAGIMATESPIPPSRANYSRIAKETEANFREQVLDQWFPRSVDRLRGGFDQNFGEDWSPGDPYERSLVYQARLTWVASKAAKRYPIEKKAFQALARRGWTELEYFWDWDNGGFYWSGQVGGPYLETEKHVYGMAFAIYACAASYHATLDPGILKLAKETFAWLEAHAHDPVNRGYYEALDRDGTPILNTDDPPTAKPFPRRSGNDAIGTVFGRKSMNTHIHLLEALTDLYGIWKDPLVLNRLREVFHIVRDRVVDPVGYQRMFFAPDWNAIPGEDSYGHDIEAAYLLVEATAALGKPNDAKTWKVARSLVDHTLKAGWDKTYGGVYDFGSPDTGPSTPRGQAKVWWVQAEGLNSLLLMHEKYGRSSRRYWDAFVREWEFISKFQVDHVHKGWYSAVSREGKARPGAVKSDGWTEAYHQGRALMNVTDRLHRLAHDDLPM
jgi:mannobiose 2-epimerase